MNWSARPLLLYMELTVRMRMYYATDEYLKFGSQWRNLPRVAPWPGYHNGCGGVITVECKRANSSPYLTERLKPDLKLLCTYTWQHVARPDAVDSLSACVESSTIVALRTKASLIDIASTHLPHKKASSVHHSHDKRQLWCTERVTDVGGDRKGFNPQAVAGAFSGHVWHSRELVTR